jgi:hypothetical protein
MNTSDPAPGATTGTAPAPRAARRAYAVSATLLAIYAVDVLAGKAAALAGIVLPWRLGDVGEFLVVLAMTIAFVVGLMCSEDPGRE